MTRVLVVEDSPTQAEALRLILEGEGFEVALAHDGQAGLERFRAEPFDMVLTDVLMPRLSGYDLCRAIKAAPAGRDAPVILLTTLGDPLAIIEGLECGADNFITKPFDAAYLVGRVRNVLTSREMLADGRLRVGVDILFMGRTFTITSDKQQILGLLISTFEEIIRTNREIEAKQEALTRSYQALHGLFRVAEGLNGAVSEAEVVERALERALELPGIRAGWVSLREGETGFRAAGARGLPPALSQPRALEGDCLCRRRLLTGALDRAANILECERLGKAGADTGGLRYHASVPLWTGDRVLGVMNLAGAEADLFGDDDLRVLHGVGHQVGVALDRARLHEHLEEKVAERTAALTAEVAERRRAEEAMGRLTAILESTTDLVGIAGADRRVLYLNRAGRTMLGIGEDEDISTGDLTQGHPEWARAFILREAIPAAVRDGVWSGETALLQRDGREVPVSQVILAHRGRDGAIEFLSTIARDVTEIKSLERQLLQAQKMEAIGRLAGGVAHDFNNLLTAITGYTELVLSGLAPDAPQRRDLGEVQKAAERAAALTRQLLAFSRQQVLQPRVLDLNAVVADVEQMLRRVIGEDIGVVVVAGPALWPVRADPGQLGQVLLNLAVNSRDAMPEGGTLTIETANLELDGAYVRRHAAVRPGPYVMLAVSDTGVGMDAEIQARIFEPFFTTKEHGKGTGLGLATVYGIVKQSGGHIWVYSEPGRGTTFKIYLPRAEDDGERPAPAASTAGPAGGSETVLLVEDEEGVRTLASRVLAAAGYTVLEARDAGEALAINRRHDGPVALLLTDLVMPGASGTDLAARLAAERPDLKVLYMSGYTGDATVRHQILQPHTAFLEKPFTPAALARKVRDVLDAPRPQG